MSGHRAHGKAWYHIHVYEGWVGTMYEIPCTRERLVRVLGRGWLPYEEGVGSRTKKGMVSCTRRRGLVL